MSSVRATGTEEYVLEGLPSTNVVQNTYLRTSYLYAIQQHNDATNGSYQLLSRFPLSGSTTLQCQDYMRLNRFGHGQTLQWFDNASGNPYFWVVTKATLVDNPSSSSSYDWGTQIGRVQYEAGATIDYTDIARLSSINHANKNGSSFGTLKRCEAALDSSREYLLIWSMNSSNKVQFAYYNATEINEILDTKETQNSKYISAGDTSVVNACVDSYEVSSFYSMVKYESIQGIEFNDTQHIYISSGNTSDIPVIQKGAWKTNNFSNNAVSITGGIMSDPTSYEVETEGIQLKGSYVHLNISTHNPKSFYVFSVPKAAF